MTIRLSLPIPPSANSLWKPVLSGYSGRVRLIASPAYTEWQWKAYVDLKAQTYDPITGPYRLKLLLPKTMRGDCDNRLKAMDLLHNHGVVPDDRHMVSCSAEKSPDVPKGRCIVELEAA